MNKVVFVKDVNNCTAKYKFTTGKIYEIVEYIPDYDLFIILDDNNRRSVIPSYYMPECFNPINIERKRKIDLLTDNLTSK